jgi:hypothetical protein
MTQTSETARINLRVCQDADRLLEAVRCSPSIDLSNYTEVVLGSYQITIQEIVCFDRSSARLIVHKPEQVLILDALTATTVLQVKLPSTCSVNYSSGFLAVWWTDAGRTLLRHINVTTAQFTSLALKSEEQLVMCVPTSSSLLLRTPTTNVIAMALDGGLSDLGAVAHIYVAEADGDCFIVKKDGQLSSLLRPSLTLKLRTSRVKCLAEGPYLFVVSDQGAQVFSRSTLQELARVSSTQLLKPSCMAYNKDREELWVSGGKGELVCVD